MYLITPRARVFALDAATGRPIWRYNYSAARAAVPGSEGTFVQNRGLAVSDGRVLFGTVDNNVVALDSRTGREMWKVAVDDPRQCGCNIGAAPLVVKDKVIVGGNNGDGAHRGYLTAFYVKTGRLAWRWYVVPGPGEKGHETWKGDSWKFGGGSPWLTGSFDPDLNLVYWGTGNAGSDFYDHARITGLDKSRDVNLYTASVVALDADTGKLRWHYQEVPDDVWDFDSSWESILIDREIAQAAGSAVRSENARSGNANGRVRKLLVHMNKSGLTFVLDRATGEFLGVFSVPELQNWIRGITEDGKLVGRREPEAGKPLNYCPSVGGAKSWNSMAYSPRSGLLYMPLNELCNDVTATSEAGKEGNLFMNGGFDLTLPPDRTT
jgi:alcohol dehydrogenase (cytochrome c)